MAEAVKVFKTRAAEEAILAAGEVLGLNFNEVAAALGIHRRTLFRYRKHQNAPSPTVREKLGKLRLLTQLMSDKFSGRDSQLAWLYSSLPGLQGQLPIDLILLSKLDDVIAVLIKITPEV